ncbi:MAG: AbrB family transcriptional regulator [Chloroflexota bacterium]
MLRKDIRERLGVQPGWGTVQELVEDHVELYFVPPEHRQSLLGVLRPYLQRSFPTEEELDQAKVEAWVATHADRQAGVSAAGGESKP